MPPWVSAPPAAPQQPALPAEQRFPLLIGIGAFRRLVVGPAWLLFVAAISQTFYLEGPDLPYGDTLRSFGYLGIALAVVLLISPLALLGMIGAAIRSLKRALAWRACDVWLSREGIRIAGGPAHGFAATWQELDSTDGISFDDEQGLQLRARGRTVQLPTARDADERASLEALVATVAAQAEAAAAARASPDGRGPRREAPDTIECDGCGAPQAPVGAHTVRCLHCGTGTPVPKHLVEKIRAMQDVARQSAREQRLVAGLLEQRGARFANIVAFAGGLLAMALSVFTLLTTAAMAFIDGKELGLPRWHGLGLVEVGFCLATLATVRWLLARRRALRLLAVGFSAIQPARSGDPPACRECHGPLPQLPSYAHLVPCAYCGVTNVMTADLRLEAGVLQRFGAGDKSAASVLEASRRSRRGAQVLLLCGCLLSIAGGGWFAWSSHTAPVLGTAHAAAIPFAREQTRGRLGEVHAGPGAGHVDRVATLGTGTFVPLSSSGTSLRILAPAERGAAVLRLQTRGDEVVHTVEQRVDAGGWPWTWSPELGLLGVSQGVVYRFDEEGDGQALFGGESLEDRVIVDLQARHGEDLLLTTRASSQGHLRVRRQPPDGATTLLLRDAREPALHPDGDRVAAAVVWRETFQVGTFGLDDPHAVRLLTRGDGHIAFPTWSPNGRRIGFLTRTVRDATYFAKRYGETHLWVVDLEGHAERLTDGADLVLVPPLWTEEGIYVTARESQPKGLATVLWRVHPRSP